MYEYIYGMIGFERLDFGEFVDILLIYRKFSFIIITLLVMYNLLDKDFLISFSYYFPS